MHPLVLAAALLALLLLLQGLLWILAYGLGRRLHPSVMVAGCVLPLGLLLPWLMPERVLAPTATLGIPGAPQAVEQAMHADLNDAALLLIPWELDVRHAFADGRLPLWSDVIGGGSSPWSNPQAGAMSPLAMLSRVLPIQYFLLAVLAFKMMVALEGAALLANACGARVRWALLAGVAFSLGGGIQAWSLFPATQVGAWFPWLALGSLACVRTKRPRAIVATALIFAAILLGGHPETALAAGLGAAVVALSLARYSSPGALRETGAGVARAALAAVLGLALSAPHVLPFLGVLPESARAVETLEDLDRDAAMTWNEPMSWFYYMRGKLLLSPLSRDVFRFPYSTQQSGGAISWPDSLTGYAGIVALATGFVALASRRRRRLALPFLGMAVACYVLASEPLPLMRVLFEIPPLRTPAYARLLLVASPALAVAGALGLQTLASARRGWWGWCACGLAGALSLAASPSPFNWVLWAGVMTLAVAMVRLRSRQHLLAMGWMAIALLDLLPWARAGLPAGEPAHFYPRTPVLERIAAEVTGGVSNTPWRVVGDDYLLYPDIPAVYDLADPRPHNPMASAAQIAALDAAFGFAPSRVQYFAPMSNLEHPFLDFLNVRVVLSAAHFPPLHGFDRLEELPPYVLWRNPDALPRWFLASGADEVAEHELKGWIAAMTDPRRAALEPGALAASDCHRVAPTTGAVAAKRARPGLVELELPEGIPPCAVLATSIPHAPGWRARADGEDLSVVTIHGGYVGVVLPAGVSNLMLRYVPKGFVLGWMLFTAASVGLVWLVVRSRVPIPAS
ncbi:MAG: YfhO family protein [Thermoanaerobaculia bacterium]|nr:YfhO family protein [Thermoanaerobaculia bacterium]